MKTKEKEALKNKTVAELKEALAKAEEKKFNLLFKHSTTPLSNPMEIRAVRREIALLNTAAHVTKDFPPAFIMTCEGDFLKAQAPIMKSALDAAGVKNEFHCYGNDAQPLWHVYHCDPKLQEAVVCNDEECSFFRSLIQ